MVLVHCFEVFANTQAATSVVGQAALFLGGPFAAPVFMALMGYYAVHKHPNEGRLFYRGLTLLAGGLLLNVGLNAHLLVNIFTGASQANPWHAVMAVDILVLAGAALMIIAGFLLTTRRWQDWLIFLLLLVAVSPAMYQLSATETWLRHLQAFVGGPQPWSYFPLLPWLVYPVAGVCFRLLVRRPMVRSWIKTWRLYLLVGLSIALFVTLGIAFPVATDLQAYYHHGPEMIAWCLGLVAMLLCATSMLNNSTYHSAPLRGLRWLGRNVTPVYVFQWLLIGNIGTALYQSQSTETTLLLVPAMLAGSTVLTLVWLRIKHRG